LNHSARDPVFRGKVIDHDEEVQATAQFHKDIPLMDEEFATIAYNRSPYVANPEGGPDSAQCARDLRPVPLRRSRVGPAESCLR
jgi:hypothetical protein